MKSDADLKQDIERELAWDTQIDEPAIGVAAHHGVVTLTGTVPCWADKHAVEEAAYRVHGVSSIANEIEIKPSWETGPTDTELAEQIHLALGWDPFVKSGRIRATVSDRGAVTLAGTVATLRERDEAERIVRGISGIRFVTNEILVEAPPVAEAKLRDTIQAALTRHAARTASHVTVAVDGDTVVLEGTVGSWLERRAVLGAARGTPGVKRVEDHLFFV
jgi:osmotically-inducible protein OsmY